MVIFKLSNVKTKMFCILCAVALLTSCAKNNSNENDGENQSSIFNFSTKSVYSLDFKYIVPEGYRAYFEVYSSNPLLTDAKGEQTIKEDIEPIETGHTDANGSYKGSISVPAWAKEIYIYSPSVGAIELMVCTIENGTLSAASVFGCTATGAKSTRATTDRIDIRDCKTVEYPNITTKILGEWIHYKDGFYLFPNMETLMPNKLIPNNGKGAKLWGRPKYMAYVDKKQFTDAPKEVERAVTISQAIYSTIDKVMPGPTAKRAVDSKFLRNSDINVTEDGVELSLIFIDDRTSRLYNVVGYYCYPTGNPPTTASEIKTQVIAFPNAKNIRSNSTSYPTGGGYIISDVGAMCPGEGVKLKYIDLNGDLHDKFPSGVSVGLVLYKDGYCSGYDNSGTGNGAVEGFLKVGAGAIYSNPALCHDKGIYTASFRHGNFVVIGFEDSRNGTASNKRWEDIDYNDVILHVKSSKPKAITDGIPEENPSPIEDIETKVTSRGILSFEDNWPSKGDFDMNDVVVEYASTMIVNGNNEVKSIEDQYTIIWSGANQNNGFACQNTNLAKGNVTFSPAIEKYDEANSIAYIASNFSGLKEAKSFKVKTKFTTPVPKSSLMMPPYNPFITAKNQPNQEVHLTNYKPTLYADSKWFGYNDDRSEPEKGLFYITYNDNNEQMPFAIDLMFSNKADLDNYVIPEERKHINAHYPRFMEWLKSNGKENSDWYLHPEK